MLAAVMGILKGEDGNRMHLLPLVNVTLSGIRIRMWLEMLSSLSKEEANTNFPAFCDMEGYMFSEAEIESVFNPILEEIQIHGERKLVDSIPRGLNV